ncbi:HYC_CC_PP family protein [Spirosoma montaniterrae]|uniref:Uncharacterized protein n=1 Tax=Spirosoma montaniterrae TaxID=1178516 RepID=A0A1P9X411_9BACT|nr:hypothetical protein [Spirosoma montaniterrae]AQG82323.1 hypothetical protein AWR27_04950 [Spirosoma montaniterrae]
MKRALFQFLNLMMACVVLLSSTGFGLVEHSCQMRGKKKTVVVAFSDAKTKPGCAEHSQSAPTNKPAVKKSNCCDEDAYYQNVDVKSSLSQLVAKFVKTVTEAVVAGVAALLAWVLNWVFDREAAISLAGSLSPPPLSGRDILTLIQSFLI